jgi:electron transfer flavoprotein beta subunit
LKQVPREPVFKRTGDSFQLDRERVEGILNPYDRYALEAARTLKAEAGGCVVAVTMGPPAAEEVLREAMALGADRAILLTDPAFAGADTLATAHTLAAAVRKLERFDLILCGARTLDSDTGQVGPQLAELLDLPMAAYVRSVALRRGELRIERRLDGTRERLAIKLPALITVEGQARIKDPVSLQLLERAFLEHSITRWTREDLVVDPSCLGWMGSATRAKEYRVIQRQRSGEVLEGGTGEAVERILNLLMERNILGR